MLKVKTISNTFVLYEWIEGVPLILASLMFTFNTSWLCNGYGRLVNTRHLCAMLITFVLSLKKNSWWCRNETHSRVHAFELSLTRRKPCFFALIDLRYVSGRVKRLMRVKRSENPTGSSYGWRCAKLEYKRGWVAVTKICSSRYKQRAVKKSAKTNKGMCAVALFRAHVIPHSFQQIRRTAMTLPSFLAMHGIPSNVFELMAKFQIKSGMSSECGFAVRVWCVVCGCANVLCARPRVCMCSG